MLDVERTVTMNLTKNSKNCCFIRHLIDFLFRKIILMQKSFFGTKLCAQCPRGAHQVLQFLLLLLLPPKGSEYINMCQYIPVGDSR